MELDLSARSGPANYDLLTQTVLPRPIAWVLTRDSLSGGLNLAPFSYFNVVASQPALFSLSIGLRADGSPKDTRRNLVAGGPAVIHLARVEQIDAVNASAAALPPGESEVEALGLATVPLGDFPLPRLANAPVAFGCRLYREVELPGLPNALLLVEAVCAYVDDAVIEPGPGAGSLPRILAGRLDPLARLGRTEYAGLRDPVSRPRPG
jgi:flavin reductase (DIM6/NTAB) family NADH-FMN oxidoreductase RutF